MFASVKSAGLMGIKGFVTETEADVQNGMPGLFLTGALAPEAREAQYRVLNGIKNSGIDLRPKKMTVNIAPASVRKHGTGYDLSIAMALLGSLGELDPRELYDMAFIGEIGLDGRLKRISGILPLVMQLRDEGIRAVALPDPCAAEAAIVEGIDIYAFSRLSEAIRFFQDTDGIKHLRLRRERGEKRHILIDGQRKEASEIIKKRQDPPGYPDLCNIRGQAYLKRAAEIAVSGRHNILFSGPAGAGKTMTARCMPGIMPGLTRSEDIEISMVYSVAGLLPEGQPLLGRRPFRAPHHGISMAAFLGGGMRANPGEVSLSSGGILFLDEMALFQRNVLEGLREPLEDRKIHIQRMGGSCEYPADFQLVASINGCPCGHLHDGDRCRCTEAQIRAYMGRLSKPVLERIDIFAEARPVGPKILLDQIGTDKEGSIREESSASVRERVLRAHEIQRRRFKDMDGIGFNSRMGVRETELFCKLDSDGLRLMTEIFRRRQLSGRACHRMLRVARTIADLDESEDIKKEHLMEAAELRSMEDRLGAYGAGRMRPMSQGGR